MRSQCQQRHQESRNIAVRSLLQLTYMHKFENNKMSPWVQYCFRCKKKLVDLNLTRESNTRKIAQ